MKVVGFHFVGPNAGEITQGFSLALKVCWYARLFVVPTAQQGWVLIFWGANALVIRKGGGEGVAGVTAFSCCLLPGMH